MSINPTSVYDKVVAGGGLIIKSGKSTLACRQIKAKGGKYIMQTALPNGEWTLDVVQGHSLVKTMLKSPYGKKGYNISTWDYTKNEGKYISKFLIDEKSFLRKVLHKKSLMDSEGSGIITYFKDGSKPPYPSDTLNIKELNSITVFNKNKQATPLNFFSKSFVNIKLGTFSVNNSLNNDSTEFEIFDS